MEDEERYWLSADPTPTLGLLYPHNTYHGQTAKPHVRAPLNLDFKPIMFTESAGGGGGGQPPQPPQYPASASATPTVSSKQKRRARRRSSNASNEGVVDEGGEVGQTSHILPKAIENIGLPRALFVVRSPKNPGPYFDVVIDPHCTVHA